MDIDLKVYVRFCGHPHIPKDVKKEKLLDHRNRFRGAKNRTDKESTSIRREWNRWTRRKMEEALRVSSDYEDFLLPIFKGTGGRETW